MILQCVPAQLLFHLVLPFIFRVAQA